MDSDTDSNSDTDNDSDRPEDPYWDLDRKTSLRILKYYAKRLNEMPIPDLSPSQLEQILHWQLIPSNATHMYEYAMFVDGFRVRLSQLDRTKLDSKTIRLAVSTLDKIGFGEPEGFPYTEALAGVAGIASVYLLYYHAIGSNWNILGSFIPLVVFARSVVTVSQAKDRHRLKQGYREGKTYRDALFQGAISIFSMEVVYPTMAGVWRWMKWHPWWSCVALLILLSTFPFLTNPVVQEWRIELLRFIRFRYFWLEGALELSQRKVLSTLGKKCRSLSKTLKSVCNKAWLMPSTRDSVHAKGQRRFVYKPGFQYDKRVRLLRINRRIPFMGIKTELIEVDLKSQSLPPYDAISHVWSHGNSDCAILVNGEPFSVTSSDYNILDQSSSYLESRIVWIDTICINQNSGFDHKDDLEKISQIKKMRKIYYSAAKVQIYLVDNASSCYAIPFMQELLRAYGASKSECSTAMMEMMARKKDDRWLRARIDSLLDLFANEWFERAWTIQEYLMARQVVVKYGKQTFDWNQFVLLAQMIGDEEVPEVSHCLMSGGNRPGVRLKSWVKRAVQFEDWRRKLLSERFEDFHEILATFQSCKATKWQDKIIALIGLSRSARRLTDLIDYSLPRDDVLLAVAQHIGRGNLLETFPYAGLSLLSKNSANLPSWLADWTVSRDVDPIVAGHNQKYDAAKGRSSCCLPGSSRREIVVYGVPVDVVKEVSNADLNFTPDAGTLQSNLDLVDKVVKYFTSAMDLAKLHCIGPDPLYEAVCHTLTGNAVELGQPMMWNHHNIVSRFLHHAPLIKAVLALGVVPLVVTHPGRLSHSGFQPEPVREFHVHAPYEPEPNQLDQVHHLLRDLERARWLCGGRDTRRRFGVTKTGEMCMLPRTTAAGDVVCVLYGSKVPMVLRKVPGTEAHQLVGEAYVHGIMDGKGLRCGVETQFKLR